MALTTALTKQFQCHFITTSYYPHCFNI